EALALHHEVLEVLGTRHRRQQEAEIQLAGGERRRLFRRQHFTQREGDARSAGLEGLEELRQNPEVRKRDEADAQAALLAARHAAHFLHAPLELADQPPRLAEQSRALGSQLDAPAAACEQLDPETPLQRADRT